MAKGNPLSMILTTITDLKNDNVELKASTRTLVKELTEVRIQLEETKD